MIFITFRVKCSCCPLKQPLSLSDNIDRIKPTPSIDATTVDIEEKGVKLRLTVVDTPGFGDAVDNRGW